MYRFASYLAWLRDYRITLREDPEGADELMVLKQQYDEAWELAAVRRSRKKPRCGLFLDNNILGNTI